ncbi:MAG: DUF2203 domain-containing protein [Alphaproteobacteria bacterium]|nr:DUF2203 domain-containing protein [Alphaproteobacteria bacterium]
MTAPDSMTPDQCVDLPVFRDGRQIISCWRLTEDELAQIAETGCVWLSVLGIGTPPVCIMGHSPVTVDGQPAVGEPYIPPAPRRSN